MTSPSRSRTALVTLLLALCGTATAGAVTPPEAEAGKRIFRDCEGCHGRFGEGGEAGRYPRLAGLPRTYLAQQLRNFRDRTRVNKPMLPIFKGGQLTEERIAQVAAYLEGIDLKALGIEPPGLRGDSPAASSEDLEFGAELYADCVLCHGPAGEGKPDTENPPLAGQYPRYLAKQMQDFARKDRWHEFGDKLFGELEDYELEALLAYMAGFNEG